MKVLSIGDQIARQLSDDKKREAMKYRKEYPDVEGKYSDIFDGSEYKAFKERHIDENSDEEHIFLGLYVDGFKPSHSFAGPTLSMFYVLNFSAPPQYRFDI